MKKLKMKQIESSGKLITFCGLDGSGKTTMMNRLFEEIGKTNRIFITKQPTDHVRRSEIFRTFMDNEDPSEFEYRSLSLLAASDRIQHTSKTIIPAMYDGNIVLSDRYLYSCLANLRARGFKKDRWIYEISESLIKPDLAFFFDVPVETAIERIRSRPEEKDRFIDVDLQHKLRREYIDICTANDGVLISTEQDEDMCFDIVKKHVTSLLNDTHLDNITEKAKKLLNEITGAEIINENMFLVRDLGMDSLQLVTLFVETEEIFGIRLDESDMNPFAFECVKDYVDMIKKYIKY